LAENPKFLLIKSLEKIKNPVLSTSLDNLVQIYPDLVELVKVWPEYVKNTIKALIQTHK